MNLKRKPQGPFKQLSVRLEVPEMEIIRKMAEDEQTTVAELVRFTMHKRAVRLGYTKESAND